MKIRIFVTSVTVMVVTFISVNVMAYGCPYADSQVRQESSYAQKQKQVGKNFEKQRQQRLQKMQELMHKRQNNAQKRFKGHFCFNGQDRSSFDKRNMTQAKKRFMGKREINRHQRNGDVYFQNITVIVMPDNNDEDEDDNDDDDDYYLPFKHKHME